MAEEEKAPDPNAPLFKRLLKWRLLAILCTVLSVGLLVGGVASVWYAADRSMLAFNDLPKYRVNTLLIDYRENVAKLDSSMANTQALTTGEPGQIVLRDARLVTVQLLEAEQQFHNDIGSYGESIVQEVEVIGGALEWNQHFQAKLEKLRVASEQRQIVIQGVINKFPVPNLPEATFPGTTSPETKAPETRKPAASDRNGDTKANKAATAKAAS